MAISELNKIQSELKCNMEESLELIKQINKLKLPLAPDAVNQVYELSFLKIYLAWESFVEKAFILFMCGERTDNGYTPKCYLIPIDEEHAYKIIKSGRAFPDWLNIEFIKEKSDLFFENGEPFKTALYPKANVITA